MLKLKTIAPCLVGGLLAAPAAFSQDIAALGKQRADGARTEWEVRDARHPALGDIRYAYMKNLNVTSVGGQKVYSRAYLSCVRSSGRIAVELTNTKAPDDPGGLQPAARPRLLCGRPGAAGATRLVQDEVTVPFDVDGKTGDALAKGIAAQELRQCVALIAVQEVVLPAGWGRKSARVEFEIHPFNRELDSIFVTCGERTAYAPPPVAPAGTVAALQGPTKAAPSAPLPPAVATAPTPAPPTPPAPAPAKTTPAPAPAKPAEEASWQTARVIFGGRTNVRARPDLNSDIVTRVEPGDFVLIQSTGSEWYRAKPARGTDWEGFIRQDRLNLKK